MKDFFKVFRNSGIVYQNSEEIKPNEIMCGYCGNVIAPNTGYIIRGGYYVIAYIYKCPHCANPIIYFTDEDTTIPGKLFGRDIKNLPDNIQSLYSECRICYANQCYTASQMIARTLLMHIAVEQGAEVGKKFVQYVDYLEAHGFIPPNGKSWVDCIRTSGNVANHEIAIKEKEETEKVILFLSALLLFIYELPNKV